MSKILDIREDHLRILSLFTRGYDREMYIREVARYLSISHGTAQTALEYLEAKQGQDPPTPHSPGQPHRSSSAQARCSSV